MTTEEFSIEFDLLYNNITSNQAPGLNLYEKSVFLTQAQEDICKELYEGSSTSFESAESVSSGLSALIEQETLNVATEDKFISSIVCSDNKRYIFEEHAVTGWVFIDENDAVWMTIKEPKVYNPENPDADASTLVELGSTHRTVTITEIEYIINAKHLVKDSTIFELPVTANNIWYILYESAEISTADCRNGKAVKVKPIKLDDLHEVYENPFVFPKNGRTILRIANRTSEAIRAVELISKDTIKSYTIKYLRKPKPIILCDLSDFGSNVSIDGVSAKTECELNESLHRNILRRAVSLAQIAWGSK